MNLNRRELIKKISLTTGGILSATTIATILSGCDNKTLSVDNTAAVSSLVPADQSASISRLVDIILPETETVGALSVGVPVFIGAIVSDVFTPKENDAFFHGLGSLSTISEALYGTPFVALSPSKQSTLATNINLAMTTNDTAVFKGVNKKMLQSAINTFGVIKELTLLGFFSSERGATEFLHYDPIPGSFHGNVALTEVGKTWATPR